MLPERRLAHVWIPNLPIQVERPRVGPGALLIEDTLRPGTLLACSAEAAALGLGTGSSRYTAQQLLPDAILVDADEHAYHALHTTVQATLQTFTPEVETVGLGEWVMDLRGVWGERSVERGECESVERGERGSAGAESVERGARERGSGERRELRQASLFERAVAAQPRLLGDALTEPEPHEPHTAAGKTRRRTQAASSSSPSSQESSAMLRAKGEALKALATAIAEAVQSACGLQVRIGVAANRFTAEQAAKLSPEASAMTDAHPPSSAPRSPLPAPRSTPLLVPPGEEAGFLAPLSIERLPHLPGEARRRLHLLDLHTLGDLAALRKPAVLRQFGGDFAGLYELACGRDPRAVRADAPPLRIVRSLLLPDLVDRGLILNALGRLARQVARALQRGGHHAEALRLTLTLDDGRHLEIGGTLTPPSSDETRLMRYAAQQLGRLDVPAPVVSAAVSAYPLRSWHLGYHQRALREAGRVSEKQGQLEEALHTLARRFGDAAVRVAALFGPPLPLPIEVELNPQGRPATFQLGGRSYAVLVVEETWREERRWWDRPIRRDYFRIQVGDGSPRTLYQDLDRETWHLDRAWPR